MDEVEKNLANVLWDKRMAIKLKRRLSIIRQ